MGVRVELVELVVLVELVELVEWAELVEQAEWVAGCSQSPLASVASPRATSAPQPSSAQPACVAALEAASRSVQPSLEPTQPSLLLVGPQRSQASSVHSVSRVGVRLSLFVEDAVATEASSIWTRTS